MHGDDPQHLGASALYMTKDQAIHRIQTAIAELRDYATIQSPVGCTSANEAITKLEEVIEAVQKRQLEYTPFAA
jgi:hypothetical protein